ncbi:Crp/Fnr family transcriptional regulator [Salinisphaera orenii]|uniref:Crp/Fnr family transcriptional regulator n=1 Tax=Salinisphaera orenii TaxID=856731 RepID=UPI000DBE21FD
MTEPVTETELSNESFFAGLPSTALSFLAASASRRTVRPSEVLFKHSATADRFYLLCTGTISVEVAAIEGPPLQLQQLGPGAILGWSWLIPPYTWHFQARAEADGAVLEFDGSTILAHSEADTGFGYELLKRFSGLMSRRLEYAREQMMAEWQPPGFA